VALYARQPISRRADRTGRRRQLDTVPAAQASLAGTRDRYVAIRSTHWCCRSRARVAAQSRRRTAACARRAWLTPVTTTPLSLGRTLVDRPGRAARRPGLVPAIRAGAAQHGKDRRTALANPRYVFSARNRCPTGDRTAGAQGVPLTPGRSIAVDPKSRALRHAGLDRHDRAIVDRAAAQAGAGQDTGSAIVGRYAPTISGAGGDAASRPGGCGSRCACGAVAGDPLSRLSARQRNDLGEFARSTAAPARSLRAQSGPSGRSAADHDTESAGLLDDAAPLPESNRVVVRSHDQRSGLGREQRTADAYLRVCPERRGCLPGTRSHP